MFSKKNRIHSFEFNDFSKNNKRIQTEFIKCLFRKNIEFRCSVVVSKKNNKKAHIRNLQKRRLIPIIKKHLHNTKNIYIFYIIKDIQNLSTPDLEKEVYDIFRSL